MSAFTSIGEGPASTVLSINSDDEMPVPRLLVVDQQEAAPEADSPANRKGQNSLGKGIHHSSVQVSDVDNGNVTVVSNKVTNPIGVAFLDDTVFWLEQRGPIMSSAMDGSNISVVSFRIILLRQLIVLPLLSTRLLLLAEISMLPRMKRTNLQHLF